ncbi:MAG: SGNH/GDSL hydrolase family protein, partial [Ginsengibacter sp.]
NSITMDGKFHHYIELFYITRFPDRKVKFYNCGISGDVANGVLRRMDDDILVHQPTWSIVMLGMNDVNRSLYSNEKSKEPGIEKKRQESLNRYFKNVDSIVRLLISAGSKVILQTPSIYDQTAELPGTNFFGVNDALKQCAEYLRELASKYNLPIVDYWTTMNTVNAEVQQRNPKATIIGNDRVHPNVPGHFLMAGVFLKTQHVPNYVSLIRVDVKPAGIEKSLNCDIKDLRINKAFISFTCTEKSLPFPLLNKGFNPDSLFHFTDELNKEIIQIKSLPKGSYILKIDSIEVGRYSENNFNEGVNLANNDMTPQYKHAAAMLQLLNQYWELEGRLRRIKYVEYGLLGKDANLYQKIDESSERRFEKSLERFKGQPVEYIDYYRSNFKEFLINKPLEKELQQSCDERFSQIQLSNKPTKHTFQIIKEVD